MKRFLLALLILLIGNICHAANCNRYLQWNEDKVINNDTLYIKNYMQCALDEKIIPLNKIFDYTNQDEYWNHISFLQEHCFDNSGDSDSSQKPGIGKYKTQKDLEIAIHKERILHSLGANAIGYYTYLNPDFNIRGKYDWDNYYKYVLSEYAQLKQFDKISQADLLKKLESQINHFSTKDEYMKDSVLLSAYVMNIIGIVENLDKKIITKQFVNNFIKLYATKGVDSDVVPFIRQFHVNYERKYF